MGEVQSPSVQLCGAGGVDLRGMDKPFRIFRNATEDTPARRIKCIFRLVPHEPEYFRTQLDDAIFANGGDVLDEEHASDEAKGYAISILDEDFFEDNRDLDCDLHLDTFSGHFIYDTLKWFNSEDRDEANRPDLNDYMITGSKYDTYDANRIMFQEAKWSDLTVKRRRCMSTWCAQDMVDRRDAFRARKAAEEEDKQDDHGSDQEQPDAEETLDQAEGDTSSTGHEQDCVPASPGIPSGSCITRAEAKRRRRMVIDSSSESSASSSVVAVGDASGQMSSDDEDLEESQAPRAKSSGKTATAPADKQASKQDKKTASAKAEDEERKRSQVKKRNDPVFMTTDNTGKRSRFSVAEGQQILDLLCANKALMFTKGRRLWEQLEESGLFPGRTYQSLKEHFKKTVLPSALKAQVYRITPEHVRQLEKAEVRASWKKHANFCPNFNFKAKE